MRSVRRKLRFLEAGSDEDMGDQPLVGGLWRQESQITFSPSPVFLTETYRPACQQPFCGKREGPVGKWELKKQRPAIEPLLPLCSSLFPMKITVIGAGAIGSVVANDLLAEADNTQTP